MKKLHDRWMKFWIVIAVALTSSAITMAADKVVVIPLSNSSLQNRITELENLLAGLSRNGNDIYFSGVNVHIIDGSGNTYGAVNGLGNLIVGYNETRDIGGPEIRTGSHNVIIGNTHNYSSYGGLVVGTFNNITAPYSSVIGGFANTTSGTSSTICGGVSNEATASYASVSGGYNNAAAAQYSHVSGGINNNATGTYSSVSGGEFNTSEGIASTVGGGLSRTSVGADDWRAGGLFQDF
jgi:hypothetical protein